MKSLLLILFLLPLTLFAQIKLEHISVDDGLSQSAVYAFTQDKKGYLWVATRDGLNQYNGSNFQVYRHTETDSSSIASNIVWALRSDQRGGVWAATTAGISYFDPLLEKFYNYSPSVVQEEFPITHTLEVLGDSVFIATQRGLWIFHISSKAWTKVQKFGQKPVHFAHKLNENNLLIGVTEGLFEYKDQKLTPILPDEIKKCKAFFKTDQELLIATETGVFILSTDLSIKKFIQLTEKPIYFNMAITQDHEGRIWVSGDGIYLIGPDHELEQKITPNRYDEFSSSTSLTTDVYTTDDGTVWVGTNGFGINKYNKNLTSVTTLSFNPYNENSLSDQYSAGLYAKKGLLYAGTRDAIDVFNTQVYPPEKIRVINLSDMSSGLVLKILPLPNGNMLLGTEKGLVEIGETKKLRVDGLRIFDLAFLSDGRVLIATAYGNEGLLIYNPTTFTSEKLNLLPKDEPLRCVLVEEDAIWVGSDRAIYKISPSLDAYDIFLKDELPFPTQVKCIFRDSQGILWVGSWGNGLYRYDEEEQVFRLFSLNHRLPNQTIYGILEDAEHNLWMSSNNGIICYKRNENQIIRFSADQGLQSNEFNTGSYYQGEDGTMFFGGIDGVSYFKPEQLLSIPGSSRLFMTNVWVNQERLDKTAWINQTPVFQPDQQNIRIEFTSVSFHSISAIRYRYKLEGQEEYIDNANVNHINLTNLSSGTYTVLINCTDSYGQWKENVISFSFTILTPIWQKTWFIALLCIALISLGLLYNYFRVRNYRKKNERLEQAVKERTVQITDQNNEILVQNEELLAQGSLLTEQNSQLELQRAELLELKNSLEKRVKERTSDLNARNEELKLQYQQMEQFSYITSHNLKGPIDSMKGLLSLLPDLGNSTDNKIIEKIQQSVLKLDSIIVDLVGIIELRKKKESFNTINVSKMLRQVINDLKEESDKKEVKLTTELCEDVKIKGIKAYFYSIFYNLIHNSIKYRKLNTNQAYVHIRCQVQEEMLIIQISDNGIGIDMQHAEKKLFRLFQRLHSQYEGKGIGLYMTKIQVESMKGSISLESKKGEGTTVTVSFPVEKEVIKDL